MLVGFYYYKGSFYHEFGIPFVAGTFFLKLRSNKYAGRKFHYDPYIKKGE